MEYQQNTSYRAHRPYYSDKDIPNHLDPVSLGIFGGLLIATVGAWNKSCELLRVLLRSTRSVAV